MSLALYKNQLICLINDGSTFVWSIEEVENFQFGQPCLEQEQTILRMTGIQMEFVAILLHI
jgi:hypothetical protein